MKILLDIDGVLVTTPSWRTAELYTDGFFKFNNHAAKNLAKLVNKSNASIILITTHRINYPADQWKELMPDRVTEIQEWIDKQGDSVNFVITDDDLSLNNLPDLIKDKCVLTKPMVGLNAEATNKALSILLKQS